MADYFSKTRPYFHNPAHQAQYETDGYIVLPMLLPDEVSEFSALFESIRPDVVSKMYANVQDQPFEVNKRVDEMLKEKLSERMAKIFINFTAPGGTMMAKGVDDESECTFHQDWSTVDEDSGHRSFTYWIPMIDVDVHNGALWVIKGSHKFFKTHRSYNFPSAHLPFTPELEGIATPLPMKAGEVCIFCNALLHGSKRNYSDTVRVNITGGVLPAEMQNIHYQFDTESKLFNIWKISSEFYYKEMAMIMSGKIPDYLPVIGQKAPVRLVQPNQQEVLDAYRAMQEEPPVKKEIPMFRDPALQAQYDEKGWVVVDFFSEEDTQYFYDFYTQNNPVTERIFVSAHQWDADLNLRFSKDIMHKAQIRATELMYDWKVEGACYIVKAALDEDANTYFDIHQDYNMVDESEIPSQGLWIALVDIDKSNGGLFALPGSNQKFAGTIRGANKPSFNMPLDEQLEPLVEYISVKAGQACIFSHALFHGSVPNYSDKIRPIIHAGLFAPGSKPYHYLEVQEEHGGSYIEVLEIDREYYYQQVVEFIKAPRKCPHTIVGRLSSYRPTPTREDLLKAYGVTPLPLDNQADMDNSNNEPVVEISEPVIQAEPQTQDTTLWSKIKTWLKF
jgi:ectoine hydroxylase-related dioxygenase (phytanoyl-CoA dioxygenase family)